MNIHEWGSGNQTVVCLHSLGTNGRMWESFARQLPSQFRVLAPDLGVVQETFDGGFTLAGEAHRLSEALATRTDLPKTLVGIGFGALAAIHMAAEFPAAARSLILVSSYVNIPGAGRERIADTRKVLERHGIDAFAADYAHNTVTTRELPGGEDLIASEIAQSGTEALMVSLTAAMQFDGRELLPKIAAPALVLTGDRDRRTLETDGRAVSDLLPDATFELVQDCGHLVPIDRPAYFAERAKRWFSEH